MAAETALIEWLAALAVGAWVFVGIVWFVDTIAQGWARLSDEEDRDDPRYKPH